MQFGCTGLMKEVIVGYRSRRKSWVCNWRTIIRTCHSQI